MRESEAIREKNYIAACSQCRFATQCEHKAANCGFARVLCGRAAGGSLGRVPRSGVDGSGSGEAFKLEITNFNTAEQIDILVYAHLLTPRITTVQLIGCTSSLGE